MNPAWLRRISILIALFVVVMLAAVSASGAFVRGITRLDPLADTRETTRMLVDRAARLHAMHDRQSEGMRAVAWNAIDSSAAGREITDALRQAFRGGQWLRLDARDTGASSLAVEFHWRGEEAAMRAGLETVAATLPNGVLERMNVRAVELNGQRLVEIEGSMMHLWMGPASQ